MGKKKKNGNQSAMVYSTNPDFNIDNSFFDDIKNEIANEKQELRVKVDRKHRNGKEVTLIEGFEGTKESLEDLGKEGVILIQGTHREKVVEHLLKLGFKNTKKSGG